MQSDLQTRAVADTVRDRFRPDLRGVLFYTATGEVEFHHVRDEVDRAGPPVTGADVTPRARSVSR